MKKILTLTLLPKTAEGFHRVLTGDVVSDVSLVPGGVMERTRAPWRAFLWCLVLVRAIRGGVLYRFCCVFLRSCTMFRDFRKHHHHERRSVASVWRTLATGCDSLTEYNSSHLWTNTGKVSRSRNGTDVVIYFGDLEHLCGENGLSVVVLNSQTE